MELTKIRDYLKTILAHEGVPFSASKLDTTQAKTLWLHSRSVAPSNIAIGGRDATGYTPMYLSLYIRWGLNAVEAEKKAHELFYLLEIDSFKIDGLQCTSRTVSAQPFFVGTDEKGIYEYSIMLNFWHERRG